MNNHEPFSSASSILKILNKEVVGNFPSIKLPKWAQLGQSQKALHKDTLMVALIGYA